MDDSVPKARMIGSTNFYNFFLLHRFIHYNQVLEGQQQVKSHVGLKYIEIILNSDDAFILMSCL